MNKRALVVGGGVGGMSCVIALSRIGWRVDLIDIDPAWRALGAGLTLAGAALRAFSALGVVEDIAANGFLSPQMKLVRRDGTLVGEVPVPEFQPGLPGIGGILRPILHRILSDRVRAAAASVRLGVSVTELNDDGRVVRASFSDGTAGDYDLVIGADSLNSSVRKMLFGTSVAPRFTGQACWRMVVPRPADQPGGIMYVDGPYAMGFNPISKTHMYMYANVPDPDKRLIPQEEQLETLRGMLGQYHGHAAEVRDRMDSTYMVNYRPLEYLFIDGPWHRGRVLLVGDAAHATTPHLGFGAGLAVEDAVVLGEELSRSDDLDVVFERFMARRLDRARFVVETAVKIGELELAERWDDRPPLHVSAAARLVQPI